MLFAVAYIDTPKGKELADKYRALEVGLPCVAVFTGKLGEHTMIEIKDSTSKSEYVNKMRDILTSFEKDDKGRYLKKDYSVSEL
jgi:hypothetical protein